MFHFFEQIFSKNNSLLEIRIWLGSLHFYFLNLAILVVSKILNRSDQSRTLFVVPTLKIIQIADKNG